jgi:hypothetical protein
MFHSMHWVLGTDADSEPNLEGPTIGAVPSSVNVTFCGEVEGEAVIAARGSSTNPGNNRRFRASDSVRDTVRRYVWVSLGVGDGVGVVVDVGAAHDKVVSLDLVAEGDAETDKAHALVMLSSGWLGVATDRVDPDID